MSRFMGRFKQGNILPKISRFFFFFYLITQGRGISVTYRLIWIILDILKIGQSSYPCPVLYA